MSDWLWPQWVILSMFAVVLVADAVRHGKQRPARPRSFPRTAMAVAINLWILDAGGFF